MQGEQREREMPVASEICDLWLPDTKGQEDLDYMEVEMILGCYWGRFEPPWDEQLR